MNKNILLDTNALLWLLDKDAGKLGPKTKKYISNANTVYVSSVSVLEMQIKSMLGKLKIPNDLIVAIGESNLYMMEMSTEHAFTINKFPKLAKHDPFDRILLAQALSEELVFVTSDSLLLDLKDCGVEMFNATV